MFSHLIKNLKLNKESKAEIGNLLSLPEVEAILSRAEEKEIAHRRELIGRLANSPSRHKKAIAEAALLAEKACHHFDQIEAEYYAARDAKSAALLHSNFADWPMKKECAEILAELEKGRDRRLDDLYIELDKLDDLARNLIQVWPSTIKNSLGYLVIKYFDNSAKINAARAVLGLGKIELERLAIAPVRRSDVAEALANICASLEGAVFALDLGIPSIDEHGEVKQASRMPVDIKRRLDKAGS